MQSIDYLKYILTLEQDELADFVKSQIKKDKHKFYESKGDYILIPGNIPITFVAHLDVAGDVPSAKIIKKRGDILYLDQAHVTYNTVLGGDNRCGVFILLQYLRRRKNRPNLLFTYDEEKGCIGASAFAQSKDTKWIENSMFCLSFDRKGFNEVVYYDVSISEFEDFIESFDLDACYGSFSDICKVCPSIGRCGANISSGFYSEHTNREYINFSATEHAYELSKLMIRKGLKDNIYYEYEPTKVIYGGGRSWADDEYWNIGSNNYDKSTHNKSIAATSKAAAGNGATATNSSKHLEKQKICDYCGTYKNESKLVEFIDQEYSTVSYNVCADCMSYLKADAKGEVQEETQTKAQKEAEKEVKKESAK